VKSSLKMEDFCTVRRRLADLSSFESARFYEVSPAGVRIFTWTGVCASEIFLSSEIKPPSPSLRLRMPWPVTRRRPFSRSRQLAYFTPDLTIFARAGLEVVDVETAETGVATSLIPSQW
jgi:hypothetical protein